MTTINADMTADQPWVPLADPAALAPGYYTLGDEAILVRIEDYSPTSVSWDTPGRYIERGVGGTTAATHTSGATLTRYYPDAAAAAGGGMTNPLLEPLVINVPEGLPSVTGLTMTLPADFDFEVPVLEISVAGETVFEITADLETSTSNHHLLTGTGNVQTASVITSSVNGVKVQSANDDKILLSTTRGVVIGVTAAPSDASVLANQACIWFDSTDGAGKLMVKAKTANGTVVTGNLPLT